MLYHCHYIVLAMSLVPLNCTASPRLTIETQDWQETFPNHNPASDNAIIGQSLITFTNRGRAPVGLKQFTLSWQPFGKAPSPPAGLIPTLYRHEKTMPPRPNESSHLAYGDWSPEEKTITFFFREPYKIVGKARLALILQTPRTSVDILRRNGHFSYTGTDDNNLVIAGEDQ